MSAPLPDRMTLRAPLGMILLYTLGSAAFVAAGYWMVQDGLALGWLGVAFFGLCGLICFSMLIGRTGLSLEPQGLTVHMGFMVRRYAWSAVSEFRPFAQGLVFDRLGPQSAWSELNRQASGATSTIPKVVIPGKLEDAAALLNAFRARAVQQQQQQQ